MLVEQTVAAPPIRKPLPGRWFIDHGVNAEMRWQAMRDQGYLTPNEGFFVRNHTRTPDIDPATWRLRVHGPGVRRDLELAYRDLEALAVDDVQSVIECAGSGGRDLFGAQQGTPVAGTPWKLGGIGAARWRGVPLRTVLELAGLKDGAVDVMAHGLDDPYICDGIDHGPGCRVRLATGTSQLAVEREDSGQCGRADLARRLLELGPPC